MVLILDGRIGAHVSNNLFDQIESSRKSDLFIRTIFLQACATCSELPYNIRTMVYLHLLSNRIIYNEKKDRNIKCYMNMGKYY